MIQTTTQTVQQAVQAPPDENTGYRNAAKGMIEFCEDFVYLPMIHKGVEVWRPLRELDKKKNVVTGRSFYDMWQHQKEILHECLVIENNDFKYKLIVFCWPRGEGKSFIACLIQAWKFFCFPSQDIALAANSKDQVKHVHFDIIKDIIINSPMLIKRIQLKNILDKQILMMSGRKKITSTIKVISSESGLISNINGYTFSEMLDMKSPKLFVQLDGSIRNWPYALGTIDSTVSAKDHLLYQLYTKFIDGKIKDLFFSYRYSDNASQEDYWHPHMTERQLDGYREKFPFGEFEKYFLNLWSLNLDRIFSDDMVDEMGYVGYDSSVLDHKKISKFFDNRRTLTRIVDDNIDVSQDALNKIKELEARCIKTDTVYSLQDELGNPVMATIDELNKIGDYFKTDFAIMVGLDFADPYATGKSNAKTVMIVIAKGLYGSRNQAVINPSDLKYLYFVLHVEVVPNHSLDYVKRKIDVLNDEYNGIDIICSERYGVWDMNTWCEDRNINFEAIFPRYELQRDAVKELYLALKEGRFKCPTLKTPGAIDTDILREELRVFDHELYATNKGWFGSPQKKLAHGIQDDCIFALIWALYGGRNLTMDNFVQRSGGTFFGNFQNNNNLFGKY